MWVWAMSLRMGGCFQGPKEAPLPLLHKVHTDPLQGATPVTRRPGICLSFAGPENGLNPPVSEDTRGQGAMIGCAWTLPTRGILGETLVPQATLCEALRVLCSPAHPTFFNTIRAAFGGVSGSSAPTLPSTTSHLCRDSVSREQHTDLCRKHECVEHELGARRVWIPVYTTACWPHEVKSVFVGRDLDTDPCMQKALSNDIIITGNYLFNTQALH